MARKTNPALIGVFVLGAAALAVGGITYFGSGSFSRQTKKFVLFFEGSLQGLTIGAPVQFRGVRIGSVVEILVRYHSDNNVVDTPVYIEIEANRMEWIDGKPREGELMPQLIERGMRAQMVTVSFVTGMLAVQLDFHPDKPAVYHGDDSEILEIPTIPSPFEQIAKTLQNLPIEDLMNDLRGAVQGLEEVVRSPELAAGIKSFHTAADNISTLAQNINQQVEPLAGSFIDSTTDFRTTLSHIADRLTAAEASLSSTLLEYRKLAENTNAQVEPLATSIRSAVEDAQGTLKQSRITLQEMQRVVDRDSQLHFILVNALAELSAAAKSVKVLADSLEQHPESLLRGKSDEGGR